MKKGGRLYSHDNTDKLKAVCLMLCTTTRYKRVTRLCFVLTFY